MKVGELRGVVCFELKAYPEPKALTHAYLRELRIKTGSIQDVAHKTGLSWSAAQERLAHKVPGRSVSKAFTRPSKPSRTIL